MANFDSAGAGMSRGLIKGFGIAAVGNARRRNKRLDEAAANEAATARLTEALQNSKTQMEATVSTLTESALEAVATGDLKADGLKRYRDAVFASASRDGVLLEQVRASGEALGVDMLGMSGRSSVDQIMELFDLQMKTAGLGTPTARGAQAGRQDVSKAETIKGGPLTEEERRQKGTNVVTPSVVNYQNQDGTIFGIDMTAPGSQKQVAKALENGAVRFGLNVQTGSVRDLPFSVTEAKAFRDAEISTRQVIGETTRLREQLGSGDLRTGLAGGFIAGIETAADQMVQVASSFGFDDSFLTDPAQYDLTGFGAEAEANAAFVSNIVNLSYVMARAQEEGRLSDADVQRQITRLGASKGRRGILAALDEVDRGVKSLFKIRFDVLNRAGATTGEFPEDLLLEQPDPVVDALVKKGRANITEEDMKDLTDDQMNALGKKLK